jgi:hypothetical protein
MKKLNPRKLTPPPEAIKRIIEKDRTKLPKNKILRFFYLFFGEGL